ncbi:MAG: hypothetical protein HY238_28260 [Acidobacteria bacterium]|nr:hypothetical protein [Acidobacteriota bacterium]
MGQVDWRNALDSAFLSHIWFGNWSFLQVRSWMYHFFGYVVLAAILGLLVRAARREPSVFPLGAFYGCFLLGVAYHTLILYAVLHDSSAPGWYIYCLVVPEAILATLGLQAVAPERWVLAVGTVCFVALDLYATHFVMIPYYAGLIAHKTNGALEAFRGQGLATALLRLQENKPAWIGAPFLVGTWLLFLAATVGLLAIQARSVYNFDNRGGTNDARS